MKLFVRCLKNVLSRSPLEEKRRVNRFLVTVNFEIPNLALQIDASRMAHFYDVDHAEWTGNSTIQFEIEDPTFELKKANIKERFERCVEFLDELLPSETYTVGIMNFDSTPSEVEIEWNAEVDNAIKRKTKLKPILVRLKLSFQRKLHWNRIVPEGFTVAWCKKMKAEDIPMVHWPDLKISNVQWVADTTLQFELDLNSRPDHIESEYDLRDYLCDEYHDEIHTFDPPVKFWNITNLDL